MRKIHSRPAETGSSSRPLNTSRAQKSVNDTSTVDFVYMPQDIDAFPSTSASAINGTPIPILPDDYSHYQLTTNGDTSPMKPQIYTVSGDYDASLPASGNGRGAHVVAAGGGASAMSEVVDNLAVEFD
ncbi:hypothetical protein EMPG_14455, partial [Blastomyces silverae]